MVRFEAGLWRTAAGDCWAVWAKDDNDSEAKNHPFARQKWFDGTLSWEQFLWQAERHFGVNSYEIERYGN